jgi:hypothetical protein
MRQHDHIVTTPQRCVGSRFRIGYRRLKFYPERGPSLKGDRRNDLGYKL